MFEFIGFLVVAFFGFKIIRFFLSSPQSNYERAVKKYLENPTDANYKFMIAARIRMENQNK